MYKSLTYLFMFWGLLSWQALAQEHDLEGIWIEAARGCNLDLSGPQISELSRSGGEVYLAKTLFQLNDGLFDIRKMPGRACLEAPEDRQIPDGYEFDCETSHSAGSYLHYEDKDFYFSGDVFNDHPLGFWVRKMRIERVSDVMKTSNRGQGCENLVRYFISYPMF